MKPAGTNPGGLCMSRVHIPACLSWWRPAEDNAGVVASHMPHRVLDSEWSVGSLFLDSPNL